MYATHKNRVMVVDDEEGVRLSWNRFLSDRGFDVVTVADGDTAVSRLKDEPVDVVISDLRMPGLDGLQLLEWVHQRTPDTPFILLTGYGNEEVERQARQLGVYEYLNKPISPEALSAVVTTAIQLHAIAARAESQLEVLAPAEPKPHRAKTFVQIVGGLILAPILGLAFVMFLPVIGFGMLFRVIFDALRKKSATVIA